MSMKKIRNLSESSFLKLFFLLVAVIFLIAALCMPDRAQMISGLGKILTGPTKLSTNFLSVGGFAATFLNMGLVALAMVALFHFTKTTVNNVASLAFLQIIPEEQLPLNMKTECFVKLSIRKVTQPVTVMMQSTDCVK